MWADWQSRNGSRLKKRDKETTGKIGNQVASQACRAGCRSLHVSANEVCCSIRGTDQTGTWRWNLGRTGDLDCPPRSVNMRTWRSDEVQLIDDLMVIGETHSQSSPAQPARQLSR